MLITSYKAVLFDFDDTLVTTIASKWDQHKENARVFHNRTLTDQDLIKVWGMAFDQMLLQLLDAPADQLDDIQTKYHSLDEKYQKTAHPGAVELVTALLDQGFTVGVLSAMTRTVVERDLKRLGFPHHRLINVQGCEDTTVHKPDPQVFEPMLALLAAQGITNLETLYVGDAIRDMEAALGAGLGFVGITNGLTSQVEFEAENVPVITALSDLLTI